MATILITGANRGIGLEMAKQAHARGDKVIATARKPDEAEALNAVAKVYPLDVLDEASIATLAEAVNEPLDLLILNAGRLNSYGGLEDPSHDLESWRDVLLTNVAGPYLCVRALLPALERASPSRIAVISSIMASSANAPGGAFPYRASKAAATNVARNLAAELKSRNIAVGSYHPGWVRTDMGGGGADITADESAKGLLERFDALSMATTGVFEDYQGEAMAF